MNTTYLTQCPRCDVETSWLVPEDVDPVGYQWECPDCGEVYEETKEEARA